VFLKHKVCIIKAVRATLNRIDILEIFVHWSDMEILSEMWSVVVTRWKRHVKIKLLVNVMARILLFCVYFIRSHNVLYNFDADCDCDYLYSADILVSSLQED
jgi:hypothetical protein